MCVFDHCCFCNLPHCHPNPNFNPHRPSCLSKEISRMITFWLAMYTDFGSWAFQSFSRPCFCCSTIYTLQSGHGIEHLCTCFPSPFNGILGWNYSLQLILHVFLPVCSLGHNWVVNSPGPISSWPDSLNGILVQPN